MVKKKKYALKTKRDCEILNKCKQLEKMKLSKEDRALTKLIKTQLEDDWRKYLVMVLNKLLEKYQKQV